MRHIVVKKAYLLMAKQQKNFRLSDECCEALKAKTLELIAEGHTKLTETEVVEMAINSFCIAGAYSNPAPEPSKRIAKTSKREAAIQERIASDIVAQEVGREDIDYSDVESTPTTHIANVARPATPKPIPTKSMAAWRAGRKPLLRPKERR